MTGFLDRPGPEEIWSFEQDVLLLCQLVSSHVVAGLLSLLHQNRSWVDASVRGAREVDPRPSLLRGWRETRIRFLGGARLRIKTVHHV